MNQRQKLKKLKRDNKLMHDIINNSSEMRRLYDDYNSQPKNIITTTIPFEKYTASRLIPEDFPAEGVRMDLFKGLIASEIFEGIKQFIHYENGITYSGRPIMHGSIYIGRR